MSENQYIEYKESWRDEYLKHICAFANSQGGSLFIGIKDDGTVIGIKNNKKLLEDIPNKVVQLLGIIVNIDLKQNQDKNIIEIIVLPSSIPISFHGKFFIRSGSTVQELQGQKLREFILKKDNITWDEITVPHAKYDELDNHLIRQFIVKAVNANRLSVEALNNDIIFTLKNLDLIKENGEITRAAILLFGTRPAKYIRTATVKIGRFGNSGADLISQDVIEGNIIEMPDKIIDILRIKYLNSPISYKGFERIEKLEYPEKAIREAVLNAIVHRDYGEQTDITIRIYDNKLVIWNSGTLISPLTIDMLLKEHPSKRRNALIANIFFRIGYIETWGRGIIQMIDIIKKANLPQPKIEEFADGIQIIFFKNLAYKTYSLKSTISEDYKEFISEKTSEKTSEKIINFIRKQSDVTIEELAKKLQKSTRAIELQLTKLKTKGIIKRIGPAKGGYWEVIEQENK